MTNGKAGSMDYAEISLSLSLKLMFNVEASTSKIQLEMMLHMRISGFMILVEIYTLTLKSDGAV